MCAIIIMISAAANGLAGIAEPPNAGANDRLSPHTKIPPLSARADRQPSQAYVWMTATRWGSLCRRQGDREVSRWPVT